MGDGNPMSQIATLKVNDILSFYDDLGPIGMHVHVDAIDCAVRYPTTTLRICGEDHPPKTDIVTTEMLREMVDA
jgi:hypothetical protein